MTLRQEFSSHQSIQIWKNDNVVGQHARCTEAERRRGGNRAKKKLSEIGKWNEKTSPFFIYLSRYGPDTKLFGERFYKPTPPPTPVYWPVPCSIWIISLDVYDVVLAIVYPNKYKRNLVTYSRFYKPIQFGKIISTSRCIPFLIANYKPRPPNSI